MKSPAQVIRQLMLDLNLGVATSADWKIFIGVMENDPNEAISLHDTEGIKDGRIIRTGEVIEHPGVMIQVRGKLYQETWNKVRAICDLLDIQSEVLVDFDSEGEYLVHNVSRTAPPIHLGQETQSDRKRHFFSINTVVTLSEL